MRTESDDEWEPTCWVYLLEADALMSNLVRICQIKMPIRWGILGLPTRLNNCQRSSTKLAILTVLLLVFTGCYTLVVQP
ncbi:hypothetical protein HOLleu_23942 [Holothuria leucospilota]|uniref:Uncharacterized protein n=1 Tax=Holothuria leucospilota TaxID=206669 RepID=A0A9Q1BVI8_HOLLE|nr:hypothetical protein HOLleu_23942 [Holothuria leucospilota]